MNILNLYAGIGGNRKLWGNEHNIIAVEYDEKIANVYKEFFPKDTVIVDDAHEYLLKHYKEFDFIWSSPPCVTHSKLILGNINKPNCFHYPDMKLYQEIILLKTFCKTKWVIENVKPYYKPLIEPSFNIGRHNFWSSDFILTIQRTLNHSQIRNNRNLLAKSLGFDINHLKNKNIDVRQVLRNCVEPEIGKYIFNQITS
jgi:DNA (cytosine-5)-methyltransferase 1